MKKITKKDKRRIRILIFCLLFLLCALITSLYSDWKQIFNNKKEAVYLSQEYKSLLQDEKSLESEVNKLQDESYVARYAREKFLLSKDGEIIIRITPTEQ